MVHKFSHVEEFTEEAEKIREAFWEEYYQPHSTWSDTTTVQKAIDDKHFGPTSYEQADIEVTWLQGRQPLVRITITGIGYQQDFSSELVAELLFNAEGKYHGDSRQMLVASLINEGLIPAPVQVCKYRI